jgi:cytochrome P450
LVFPYDPHKIMLL